jgi:hypothetical protein
MERTADIKTNCNHRFCDICIKKSIKISNFCPYCRAFDPLNTENKIEDEKNIPNEHEWNIASVRRVIWK